MHQVLFTNRDEAFLEKEHHQKTTTRFHGIIKIIK